jgi:hypothetical protein
MGANAQTTVPTFTSGQVLTAEQQNQSARTGVPVFATTVERDAAFNGSGEKVLAEGQLAYLEDSNIVQYYDGAAWATVGPIPGGLALISTTTIGTAVASVTVSGAFSATYDNYRIIVSGGAGSTNDRLKMTVGATTTGYYSSAIGQSYGNVTQAGAVSNGAAWDFVGYFNTDGIALDMQVLAPNLAKNTFINGGYAQNLTTGAGFAVGGYVANTTQYTAFTITTNAGTLTGGTIRVYGYANS